MFAARRAKEERGEHPTKDDFEHALHGIQFRYEFSIISKSSASVHVFSDFEKLFLSGFGTKSEGHPWVDGLRKSSFCGDSLEEVTDIEGDRADFARDTRIFFVGVAHQT